MQLIAFTWSSLALEVWTIKRGQIMGGLWNFGFQLRRPCMSIFRDLWKKLHSANPLFHRKSLGPFKPFVKVSSVMQTECMLALCTMPLLQADMRSAYSGMVTVSDASETGAGVCASTQLSEAGKCSLALLGQDDRMDALDQVALIEVFAGAGGVRRGFDLAKIDVAAYVAIERNPLAQAVLEYNFPEGLVVADVATAKVQAAAFLKKKGCHVTHLVIAVRCPVASLERGSQAHGRDTMVQELWDALEWLTLLAAQLDYCTVWKMGEAVVGLALQGMDTMRALDVFFGRSALIVDLERVSGVNRQRVVWTSWEVQAAFSDLLSPEKLPVVVEKGKPYLCACLAAQGWVRGDDAPLGGFLDFHRPVPRRKGVEESPLGGAGTQAALTRMKADDGLFEWATYESSNCVRSSCPAEMLCGDCRPLCIEEKEFLMGFAMGRSLPCFSRTRRRNDPRGWLFERQRLLGLAWSPLLAALMMDDWSVASGHRPCVIGLKMVCDRQGPWYSIHSFAREQPMAYEVTSSDYKEVQRMNEELWRRASHRTTELRLGFA